MRNLTEPLLQGSRAILERLPAFEKALESPDLAYIRSFVRFLTRAMDAHRHAEEEVILPVLIKHLEHEQTEPHAEFVSRPREDHHWSQFQVEFREQANRLHAEHGWLSGTLTTLREAIEADVCVLSEGEIRATGSRVAALLRRHLTAEIDWLFPITEGLLTEGEKQGLRSRLATRHDARPFWEIRHGRVQT